ncbi:MAG: TMEM43 family protein [Notoacmeibacter sp.]|nr:TMEM43 family protein [Notoacmeibacter sp.]MCC0031607.1 TMEM43 family protein [Brucellaceae bacterium]
MADEFTEVTHRSWFSRIGGAFSGILVGIVLVLASIAGLFWNEGRAVHTARALEEGSGQVITIDPANPGADANGKLVHFSGPLKVDGTLSDPQFGFVSAPANANRLVRKVEMFQWKESSRSETRKKLGGGEETVTTYSYSTEWAEGPVNSQNFKKPAGHENPAMPVRSATTDAKSGKVGAISLPGGRIAGLGERRAIAADAARGEAVKSAIGLANPVTASDTTYFIGQNPSSPQVGDLRISFEAVSADTASAYGRLDNGSLDYFTASNGVKIGSVRAGIASAKDMFDADIAANSTMTWIIRAVGLIAMLIGFRMIFAVIGVIGDVIPFVGDVFRFATGMAALALTAVIGTITIGTAWIWYRPLLGWSIIAIGALIAIAVFKLGKGRAKANRDAEAQPA